MKRPAYAKKWLDFRRAHGGGWPPVVAVDVILGHDWTPPGLRPWLAIRPGDFAPGRFDWTVAAGLSAAVWVERAADADAGRALAAELAAVCPEVALMPEDQDIAVLAFAERRIESGRYQWPAWWSDDKDKGYGRRQHEFRTWAAGILGQPGGGVSGGGRGRRLDILAVSGAEGGVEGLPGKRGDHPHGAPFPQRRPGL